MSLNDPFKRMEKQQQGAYQSFINALKKSGVNDDQSAKNLLDNTLKRALQTAVITAIITAVTWIINPELGLGVAVFSLLILLWLFTTTLRARKFIRRYRQEELQKKSS
ncbi:MAG: hypothetical protein H8E21_06775 [Gammaproteobacteria bacterium]|nr:hypothetical protein [Gammaproteobacteria bacterium]MBL6999668.1 hypothetical protein [Gammaproteobacteria bacterium]